MVCAGIGQQGGKGHRRPAVPLQGPGVAVPGGLPLQADSLMRRSTGRKEIRHSDGVEIPTLRPLPLAVDTKQRAS